MKKKILIFICFLSLFNFQSKAIESKILFKVENEIITSLDIIKEKKYLILLNPKLKNLDNEKLNNLATQSIINEKIKELEVKKYFSIDYSIEDPNLKDIIKGLYSVNGITSEQDFIKYLNDLNLEFKFVKEKISIEIFWNNFIFRKYNNQVVINNELIKEEISNEVKKLKKIKEYNLSEIQIEYEKNIDINEIYKKIIESDKINGFENTATLFSISETAKYGGKIGWVNETSLSTKVNKILDNLKIGELSSPIKIANNIILLKINDIKYLERKIDINKIFKSRVSFEKNQQLERFSIAYLNKIKKNININEL